MGDLFQHNTISVEFLALIHAVDDLRRDIQSETSQLPHLKSRIAVIPGSSSETKAVRDPTYLFQQFQKAITVVDVEGTALLLQYHNLSLRLECDRIRRVIDSLDRLAAP